MSKRPSLLSQLDELIATRKTASAVAVAPVKKKKAEAESEPQPSETNMDGKTESPSKTVDDQTQPNEEGSHAKENDKDVKDLGVEPLDKTAMDKIINRLTGKVAGDNGMDHTAANDSIALTGEDPKNELSGVLSNKKEDPGSTTPLRVDNEELDGKKYASMDIKDLYPAFNKAAGELMLDINDMLGEIEVAPAAGKSAKTAGDAKVGQGKAPVAGTISKKASAEDRRQTLEVFVRAGADRAELVGQHLSKIASDNKIAEAKAQLTKNARAKTAAATKVVTPAKRAADAPPPPPDGGGGGGADMGGGGPPPPDAAAGGPPGGGAPGGEGGEMSDEEIVQLLKQQGMSDEEIQQLLDQAHAQGGGADAGAGGPPPPDAGAAGGADASGGAPPPPAAGAPKMAADKVPAKVTKLTPKAAAALAEEIIRRSR